MFFCLLNAVALKAAITGEKPLTAQYREQFALRAMHSLQKELSRCPAEEGLCQKHTQVWCRSRRVHLHKCETVIWPVGGWAPIKQCAAIDVLDASSVTVAVSSGGKKNTKYVMNWTVGWLQHSCILAVKRNTQTWSYSCVMGGMFSWDN